MALDPRDDLEEIHASLQPDFGGAGVDRLADDVALGCSGVDDDWKGGPLLETADPSQHLYPTDVRQQQVEDQKFWMTFHHELDGCTTGVSCFDGVPHSAQQPRQR